ncbi:MAG: malto-oligosyltrehalose trehalohydrolase [Acidobacteriota bacterium]
MSGSPERYRVWAPRAGHVALDVNGQRIEMAPGPDGWWSADREMHDGDLYGYVVDGTGPLPDPRSTFQPAGVHGLSQCVRHERFEWTDARWQAPPLGSGVLYELHVGTFSEAGTFAGAIAKLPHLVDLGITHLELMPVAQFSGDRGWGYDGVDLFAPHGAYGEPDDLKRLVDSCHAHGMAVVLDVVYNHFGPAGNYASKFAPYFTSRYTTPWGDAVNLDDVGSHEVRRFFCDNALMWLRDYHFDGLRLDAVHAFIDTSPCHFLEQLATEVDALESTIGRHLVLIAESDLNDSRVVGSREAGGYGIDAQWSDDFHHALHALLTGEQSGYYEDFGTLEHFATAVREAFVYGGVHSKHRQRLHGRPVHDLPGWRFVVAAQNHDQVGNRAQGERLTHLVSADRLKVAAGLLFSAPFVPLVFQGEEWGASSPFQYFTSHEDPTLAAQVSAGRRKEFEAFGWDPESIPDPQSIETFERSRLRWNELPAPAHTELLEWYRALTKLRRDHPSLRDGKFRNAIVSFDESAGWLFIQRGTIGVACNLGKRGIHVDSHGAHRIWLSSAGSVRLDNDLLFLPGDSIAFVEIETGEIA